MATGPHTIDDLLLALGWVAVPPPAVRQRHTLVRLRPTSPRSDHRRQFQRPHGVGAAVRPTRPVLGAERLAVAAAAQYRARRRRPPTRGAGDGRRPPAVSAPRDAAGRPGAPDAPDRAGPRTHRRGGRDTMAALLGAPPGFPCHADPP